MRVHLAPSHTVVAFMNRVVISSIHSHGYHCDGAFASGSVLLRPFLAVCPAVELFSGGVVGTRIIIIFIALLPITLFLHLILQHIFNLLLQSRHQSLPFGFLALFVFIPCPELFLLFLAEEMINLRRVLLVLKLEVLRELRALRFHIQFITAALPSGDVPLLTLLEGCTIFYGRG